MTKGTKTSVDVSRDPDEEADNVTIPTTEVEAPLQEEDQLTSLMVLINALDERVTALEQREQSPVSVLSNPNHAAPDDVIESVERLCGKEFEARVEVQIQNVSFGLTIIQPERLRETPEDRRFKCLTYVEGIAGVEAFAKSVAENCRGFAFKHGIQY